MFERYTGELRHVAWPTPPNCCYTILVALISIGVALYLGLFDFLFTTGLARIISAQPAANPIQITQQPATTLTPTFEIATTTQQ